MLSKKLLLSAMGASCEVGGYVVEPDQGLKITRGLVEYQQTGVAWPATGYTEAANVDGLKINGIASSGFAGGVVAKAWAHNGNGTIIVLIGSATHYYLSTDYGATWALVQHGMAEAPTVVLWAFNKFFLYAGTSQSTILVSSSPTGLATSSQATTWAAVATIALGNANDYRNYVTASFDGTRIIVLPSGSVGQAINSLAISTTGTAYAGVSLYNAATAGGSFTTFFVNNPAAGNNRWLSVWYNNGTAYHLRSTAADGTAWQAVTLPTTKQIIGLTVANNLFVLVDISGDTFTSPTAATGSWTKVGAIPTFTSAQLTTAPLLDPVGGDSTTLNNYGYDTKISYIQHDGTRFLIHTGPCINASSVTGVFSYSTDLITWTTRQLTYAGGRAVNGQLAVLPLSNSRLFTFPLRATDSSPDGVQYCDNWFSTPNYIGRARPVAVPNPNSNNSVAQKKYVRTK